MSKVRPFIIISFLVLIAFFVKVINLSATNLGADECFSVYAAQLSPSDIITWLSTGNNPPLWELILHFWIKVFGISEFSVRFPALLFSCLTVVPIYLLGEKHLPKYSGILASVLFIFSSFSLFIAHEARVYSLLALLSTLSVYLFLELLKKENKLNLFIFLTIVNVFIIYSHYFGYWIILTQMIAFLSIKSVRQSLGYKYLWHLGVLFFAFTPLISVLITRFNDSAVNGTWVSKSLGFTDLYNMLWKYANQPLTTVIFLIIIISALVLHIFNKKKVESSCQYLIHLFIWLPLLISFLVSFKLGIFLDRYFYFLLPLFYLSLACCLQSIFVKKSINLTANLVVCILMIITFIVSREKIRISGFHEQTELVANEVSKFAKNKSNMIILCPKWYDKEIVYYLDKGLFQSYFEEFDQTVTFKKPLEDKNIYPINYHHELKTSQPYKTVIFIGRFADFHVPNNEIYNSLLKKHQLKDSYQIDATTFSIFSSK